MRLTAIAISNSDWSNQNFFVVTQQAKDSARKIVKGIDIGIERRRFNNACNRIENLALQKGKEIKIEEKKFQEMLDSISEKSNIFFPFLEHDSLKALMKYFDENSKKYLTKNKSTLLFIVNEFSQGAIKLKTTQEDSLGNNTVKSNIVELNKVESLNINEIQNRFHKQILTAIEKGTPMGWINLAEGEDHSQTLMRHEGIISCLREHIFVSKQPTVIEKYTVKEMVVDKEANEKRSKSIWFQIQNFFSTQSDIMKQIIVPKIRTVNLDIIPRNVQFAFSDGSITELFPLYSMIEAKPKDKLQVIKVALISNRHFELDSIVETCILRNSEISRRQEATIADQEKLSFEIAQKFFTEIIEKTGGIHIELFHTGLEPAVIGTYRALITILLKKELRGKIVVTPKVFKGGEKYDDLKLWY
jgi:hypothetical protein